MRKRSRSKGKKLDLNELASDIAGTAVTPEPVEPEPKPENQGKDPLAVELGRRGGLKGGKARAKKMTKKQRSEAARKAAKARWRKRRMTTDSAI